jgi:hypothetical protein
MFRKYSFIPMVFCILLGLTWWSTLVQTEFYQAEGIHSKSKTNIQKLSRREVLETLDRIVAYEQYYHSVYGYFTKIINRTGFSVPAHLSDLYDIRIAEASKDKLLVTATVDDEGKVKDVISIDQDYQVRANFTLPEPSVGYIKERALKHLRLLQTAPQGQGISEVGVFKGFFSYSHRFSSKNEKTYQAVGIKAPVQDVHLELKEQDALGDSWNQETGILSELLGNQNLTGQSPHTGQVESEDMYLAQTIFRGEMGRYAKTWEELSKIAHFKFEKRDSVDSVTPENDLENSGTLKAQSTAQPASLSRKISSHPSEDPLVIEEIPSAH